MTGRGLSSEEANKLLLDHINERTRKYEESNKKGLLNHLYHLVTPGNLASVISLPFIIPEFKSNWNIFAGIFPWFIANIIVESILYQTEIRRRAARLYDTMDEFVQSIKEKSLSAHHVELDQPKYLLDPPSSSLIPILRDGEWKRLPQNVIVPGDVFKIPQGNPLPCEAKNPSFYTGQPKYVSPLPDIVAQETNINLWYNTWTSTGFGCDLQLDAFLDSLDTPRFENGKISCQKFEKKPVITKDKAIWDISNSSVFVYLGPWNLFIFGFITSIIIFFISYVLSGAYPNFPFLRSYTIFAYSILLFISPIKEALTRWIKFWGNVKLQSLFEWHHESRFMGEMDPESSHLSTFESSSSADSVDSDMAASQIPLFRQLKELFSVFIRGFDGRDSLLNLLSSVTLLCFVDHIGILSEASSQPLEIAIPFKYKKEKSSRNSCDKKNQAKKSVTDDSVSPTEKDSTIQSEHQKLHTVYQTDLMILDVYESNSKLSPGHQYIRFGNEKEKESESLLRPICLAASFTQIPRYKVPSLHIQPSKLEDVYLGCFANSYTLAPYNDCKCGLAGGMRLSKNYIRKFRIMRTVIAIDHMPRNPKHYDGALIFFIVKNLKSNNFQLFVKGKVSLLLDFKTPMQFLSNSDSVFDMNILTRGLKRKIRNLNIQWISSGMEPIAYAYKPLSNVESNILLNNLPPTSIFCIASISDKSKSIGLTEPMRHSRPQFIQLFKYGDSDMIFTQHPLRGKWIDAFKSCNLESKLPLIFEKEIKSMAEKKGDGFTKYISLDNLEMLVSSVMGNEGHGTTDLFDDESNRSWNSEDSEKIVSEKISKSNSVINYEELFPSRTGDDPALEVEFEKDVQNDIISPFIGDLLCKSLENLCFLGMYATKMQCPKEVPMRIQNLHGAGIRMVYFSKEDEKSTKKFGSMLGLDTNWNCMISLSESRTATLVNRDGNVVLPSGIENIRKHINEIDDIPLKVSLFFNCTVMNIVQMMNILRENGETIMCIGSGLRPFNFFIFQAADVSLSISLWHHPICRFCRGLRWRGIARSHIFDPTSPEFQVSSSLTSLPCALKTAQFHKVADPYFVMEMLFEVFKEARRLDSNVQQAVGFMTTSFWSLAILLVCEIALKSPPLLKCSDLSLIICCYIPLLSASLMANPSSYGTMERMPSRSVANKHKMHFWPLKMMYHLVPNILVICLFFMYHLWDSQSLAVNSIKGAKNIELCNFLNASSITCVNKINDYLMANGTSKTNVFAITQEFTFMFTTIYLVLSSYSWINRYEGVFTISPCSNVKWLIASATILLIQSLLFYFRIRGYKLVYSKYAILIASLWTIILLLLDELYKARERANKNSEQKYLRLLFSTKLGMWSPK